MSAYQPTYRGLLVAAEAHFAHIVQGAPTSAPARPGYAAAPFFPKRPYHLLDWDRIETWCGESPIGLQLLDDAPTGRQMCDGCYEKMMEREG